LANQFKTGINNFGQWIATSADNSSSYSRRLLRYLRAFIATIWIASHVKQFPQKKNAQKIYTALGDLIALLTGANVGTQVFGQDPRC